MAQVFRNLLNSAPSQLPSGSKTLFAAAAGIGAVGYTLYNGAFRVEGGHCAIIFNRIGGVGDGVVGEGLHFNVPYFQWPIDFDVRTKPKNFASPTGTKGTGLALSGMACVSLVDTLVF